MLRNNQSRARMARLVFLFLALASGGLIVLSVVGLGLPDWDRAGKDAASSSTMAVYYVFLLLGVAYFILLIISYIVLILWLRRAYYNLHQLPGINPEYSDGWAAGAWFVPFINFARPFTIMREVWQDTQVAAWGRIVEPATVLGWWWAAFILKMVISRITAKMGSDTSSGFEHSDLVPTIIDAVAQLLAAGFTWYVIGRMAGFEEQLVARQQIDQLGQPAPLPTAEAQAKQADYQLEEGY